MRTLIAALLCLVALTALDAQLIRRRVYAAPPVTYRPAPVVLQPAVPPMSKLDEKKDGHIGYNAGEVADLPQDVDKLCMILVLSDDWEHGQNERAKNCRAVKSWLETDKRLIQYRSQSKFSFLLSNEPAYTGLRTLADGKATSLYAKLGDAFPILEIEKPDGEMVFKMSALSLAKNAGDCADRVTLALKGQEKKAPTDNLPLATPFVTEGEPEQCPPNGPCPVNVPRPDNSEVLDDTPLPMTGAKYAGLAALGFCGAVAAGLGYVGARRPGLQR